MRCLETVLFILIFYGLGYWLPEDLILGLDKCAEGEYDNPSTRSDSTEDMVGEDGGGSSVWNDMLLTR